MSVRFALCIVRYSQYLATRNCVPIPYPAILDKFRRECHCRNICPGPATKKRNMIHPHGKIVVISNRPNRMATDFNPVFIP